MIWALLFLFQTQLNRDQLRPKAPQVSYGYYRTLTIDHLQVGTVNNTSQTNFPVLLSGTLSYLALVGAGGKIEHAGVLNGLFVPADLIFTSDAAGLNLLNWEVASWVAATGDIEVWIKIPTLSHTVDTVIYMFYGDASVTTYQGGALGAVWDSDFNIVHHFADGVTLALNDSTTNAGNVTVNVGSTAAAGKIDGGVQANNHMTIPDSSLTRPAHLTFSLWFNYAINAVNYARIVQKGNPGSAPFLSFAIFCVATDQTNIAAQIGFTDGSSDGYVSGAGHFFAGTWYKLALTFDGTTVVGYLNGVQVYSNANSRTINYDSTTLAFGGDPSGGGYAGKYDEFRLSKIARTPDWIITEYNTETSSTFIAVGPENSVTPPSTGFAGRRTFGRLGTRVGSRQLQ